VLRSGRRRLWGWERRAWRGGLVWSSIGSERGRRGSGQLFLRRLVRCQLASADDWSLERVVLCQRACGTAPVVDYFYLHTTLVSVEQQLLNSTQSKAFFLPQERLMMRAAPWKLEWWCLNKR
jgi:hypothetical protein